MRVLVVDQDSTLLTAISRTLGEYFSIDAVTTKGDCLDLVRVNEFEVIVAGERLEDGSGLELLGSLARTHPDMLRIFAAERERLKLLKGRLGPFGLFRTLSYPIEPRQLLAALSAAAGIEEEFEESTEAEAPPPPPEPARRTAPAAAPSRPQASAAVSVSAPPRAQASAAASVSAPQRAQASVAASVSAPPRAQASVAASVSAPPRAQASVAASVSAPPRAQASAAVPASTPSRTQAPGAVSASSLSRAQASPTASEPSRTSSQRPRVGRPASGALQTAASRQVPRQPSPAALAAASKLDIVNRPKGFPPPGETTPGRSAFLVGAGVVLVLGGLALSFKIFNTKDEPVTLTTNVPATRSPHFPPEVVKLVADTEVAFQQDNFKTARTDVAALQQIAPDHPRLPFFEALLKRLETNTQSASKSGSGRFWRHTSASTAPGAAGTAAAGTTAATRADTQRRQPDMDRDAASAESASEPAARATVATFSGRTLEDSSLGTPTQPLATPSQAMAAPVPRRPGSAAPPSVTEDPRLVEHVDADYPPEAARKGIEGSVDVSFTISPQGKVTDVAVVSAMPSDIFNRAAIAAVRRWKYEPKTVNGVPVEAHQQLRLQFKLDPRGG
jgi:TonB family protein